MLFQLGAVTIDVGPYNVNEVSRQAKADFAAHDLINRIKGQEPVGEGDDTLSLKGQILPSKARLDGSAHLETLHGMRRAQQPVLVMRGDGRNMGWFVITDIDEEHETLSNRGVGHVIKHEVKLLKVDGPGTDGGLGLLTQIISLFG